MCIRHKYIFIGNVSLICSRRLKFLRDYTWSVYRGSKEAKDKRNSGKWKGIFIANKTFSMVTIVATVYNSRTCNGIAWNRSILFHSIFPLFHHDPSSVSTFQWQLWSKLNKSSRYIYFFFASFARRSYSNYFFFDEIIIPIAFRLNDKFYLEDESNCKRIIKNKR